MPEPAGTGKELLMAAIVVDGKALAAKVRIEVKERVEALKKRGINPCLAVILVGEDPGSLSYIRGKQKALADAGIEGWDIRLPEAVSEPVLLGLIKSLNKDPKVHGILIQLPLPAHIREDLVISSLDPSKDIDCFHPTSFGKLLQGQQGYLPCTPHGVVVMLRELKVPIAGAHAVVVGRSNHVGKALAMLLSRRDLNATVTLCHKGTKDLASHTIQADILISAAGKPGLITGAMIKSGAAVIDVGVNVNQDTGASRLVGDVNYEEALEKAGWITPVPGGVGPMTIAMLTKNVVEAAENHGV